MGYNDGRLAFHLTAAAPILDERPIADYFTSLLDIKKLGFLRNNHRQISGLIIILKSENNTEVLGEGLVVIKDVQLESKQISEGEALDLILTSKTKVFVAKLPVDMDNVKLWNYFSRFGAIQYTKIIRKGTPCKGGFGFIFFEHRDAVEKALKSKHIIEGKYISCKRYLNKNHHFPISEGGKCSIQVPRERTIDAEEGSSNPPQMNQEYLMEDWLQSDPYQPMDHFEYDQQKSSIKRAHHPTNRLHGLLQDRGKLYIEDKSRVSCSGLRQSHRPAPAHYISDKDPSEHKAWHKGKKIEEESPNPNSMSSNLDFQLYTRVGVKNVPPLKGTSLLGSDPCGLGTGHKTMLYSSVVKDKPSKEYLRMFIPDQANEHNFRFNQNKKVLSNDHPKLTGHRAGLTLLQEIPRRNEFENMTELRQLDMLYKSS